MRQTLRCLSLLLDTNSGVVDVNIFMQETCVQQASRVIIMHTMTGSKQSQTVAHMLLKMVWNGQRHSVAAQPW